MPIVGTGQTTADMDLLKRRLKNEILGELGENEQISDEALYARIDALLFQQDGLSLRKKLYLRNAVYNSFRRLDLLSELLDDSSVTEIMINSYDEIFIERNGRMLRWERSFDSPEQLEELIQQIVSRINRVVNTSSPIVDARLPDGSRVHVVLPPVALKGATMTIRKFPEPITMEKLIAYGSITREAADFLESLVQTGYNIFISGGTNSGKTTFLNALSAYIPPTERVVTIEDSAELRITQVPNLVSMETRNANSEGNGAVTIADLIRASLRMSPNRIVVGEVRGSECLDMLNAMNTGHEGSLSTGHANSCRDMLRRMEIMVLQGSADLPLQAIRSMIASAVEIMVHLGRDHKTYQRRVLSISEILGVENGEICLQELYGFDGTSLEKRAELTRKEKRAARL